MAAQPEGSLGFTPRQATQQPRHLAGKQRHWEGRKGRSFCSLECQTREWICSNLGFERWDQTLKFVLQGVVAGVWGGSDHRLDCFFPKERAPGQLEAPVPGERLLSLPGAEEGWLKTEATSVFTDPYPDRPPAPGLQLPPPQEAPRGCSPWRCPPGWHPQTPSDSVKTLGQDVTPRLPGAGFTAE